MRPLAALSAVAAGLIGSSIMLAAPGQTTSRPGDMTDAQVVVRNRATEPIPIVAPLPIQVRTAAATWDYETLLVRQGVNPVVTLNSLGREGWEVTGAGLPVADGTLLVLKRVH